jgi:hypothetical protein
MASFVRASRINTITLNEQYNGLRPALQGIMKQDYDVNEAVLRFGWIKPKGERLTNPNTQSKIVLEYAKYYIANMQKTLYV